MNVIKTQLPSCSAPASERCIAWDDPLIGIEWPDIGMPPLLSKKDAASQALAMAEMFN